MSSFRDLKNSSGRDSKIVQDFASSDICVSLGLKQTSYYVLTSFGKGISLMFHLLAPVLTVDCHWSTALSVLPDAKITELMSIPDRDGQFTWSPGAEKLPTAPGGSWREDVPGWEKSRARIHGVLRPACVCSVSWSPPYIHVCVAVCRLCNKKLIEVSLVV